MSYANKLDSMTRTIAAIESKLNGLNFSFSSEAILGESLDTLRRVTLKGIETLKGLGVKAGEINGYQKALESDEYLENAWIPLAVQLDANLNSAMGLAADWTPSSIFQRSGDSIAAALPSSLSVNTGLGFAALALIALAVIVVFK